MSPSPTPATTSAFAYPSAEVARAVDACRATARALAADLDTRAAAALVARANWDGVHRRSFDTALGACTGHVSDVHDGLLRLALSLQADQAAADHENARRAARRAEVEAEHRRQERAAAAAAPAPVAP